MSMHVPLRKLQPWVLPVTLVCFALGIFIALLLHTSADDVIDASKTRPEQLAMLYTEKVHENSKQEDQIIELRTKLDKMVDGATNDQKLREALRQEINDLRVRAGTTGVEGPGVIVTIDDTNVIKSSPNDLVIKPNTNDLEANALLVHDSDLLLLVNELRSAGVEALDINGQRVIGSTAIRCVGPVIQVNSHQVAPPFVIHAIGKPDTLSGALNLPNGELDNLRVLGIRVEVVKRDHLLVPAAMELPSLESGKPVANRKANKDLP